MATERILPTISQTTEEPPKKDFKERSEEERQLPPDVQQAYDDLPDRVKVKIFKESAEEEMAGLDVIIKMFSQEELEKFVGGFLTEFFDRCKIEKILDQTCDTLDKKKAEIKRLMDVLWSNKGKKEAEITLFNEAYYKEYKTVKDAIIAQKKSLAESIAEKKEFVAQRLNKMKSASKRMAQEKILLDEHVVPLLKKLKVLEEELDQLVRKHGDTIIDFSRSASVRQREKYEKSWFADMAVLLQYFDSMDFSILFSEKVDLVIAFNEHSIMHRAKRLGLNTPERKAAYKNAEAVINAYNEAVEQWQADHADEGVKIESKATKKQEKQSTLIRHFRALLASYQKKKTDGQSEEELNDSIREMTVALNILKAIS